MRDIRAKFSITNLLQFSDIAQNLDGIIFDNLL